MAEVAELPSSSVVCAHCGLPTRPARGDAVRAFCCLGCRLASAATGGRVGAKAAFLEARLLLSAFLSMGVMEFTLVLYGEDFAASPDPATVALRRLGQIALAVFTVPVLLLLGVPLLKGAWHDLRAGRIRMDGLIVLGTFSAFGLSLHHTILGEGPVYYETATTVLTLVMLGRRLEATVRAEGRHAADHLADALPRAAHRVTLDGTVEDVAPDTLRLGDRIVVRPGEAFPADVTIRAGAGSVACDRITGEEVPREIVPGDLVLAGSANGVSIFEAVVVRPWAEGWLGAVRALLDAPLPPTRIIRRVDRIAGHLAWISIALAGYAAYLGATEGGVGDACRRSLSVLLVACPCALGLATPLAYRAIRAALARKGLLVAEVVALEIAPDIDLAILDKTGTLTDPAGTLDSVGSSASVGRLVALVEASNHALARAVRPLRQGVTVPVASSPTEVVVTPGAGVSGRFGELIAESGSFAWITARHHLSPEIAAWCDRAAASGSTLVTHAEAGTVVAAVSVRPTLRSTARDAVDRLRRYSVDCEIASGDRPEATAALAKELGIPAAGALLPQDKQERLARARREGRVTLMVGDGINDAPALHAADVSIAMGSGTALARAEAQVEIAGDDLTAIPLLIEAGKTLRRVVRGNLAWTFAYNAAALALAVTGNLHPIAAALAMVLSSLVVGVRSARLLRFGAETPR